MRDGDTYVIHDTEWILSQWDMALHVLLISLSEFSVNETCYYIYVINITERVLSQW